MTCSCAVGQATVVLVVVLPYATTVKTHSIDVVTYALDFIVVGNLDLLSDGTWNVLVQTHGRDVD